MPAPRAGAQMPHRRLQPEPLPTLSSLSVLRRPDGGGGARHLFPGLLPHRAPYQTQSVCGPHAIRGDGGAFSPHAQLQGLA